MTRTAGLRGRRPAKQGADKFPIGWLHDYLRSPLPAVKLPVDVTAGIVDWRMLGNGPDPTLTVNGGRPVGDCLGPETRVLTADLRWVPISTLCVGDELLGFEEDSHVGHGRRFVTSRVEAVRMLRKPCYDLEVEDGTVVRASFDHQWMRTTRRDGAWVRTDRMRAGERGASSLYRCFPTWDTEDSFDMGYLAAAFDGEGCLSRDSSTGQVKALIFSQRDNAMLLEVRRVLAAHGYTWADRSMSYSSLSMNGYERLVVGGRQQVVRLLGQARPKRLLDLFKSVNLGRIIATPVSLVEKKDVGVQWVVAVQTSTRTFIAEGFLSHNCTFAGREHYRMAKAGANSTAETTNQLVAEYLAYDHGRDEGANIADLLLAWYKAGKILAFAPVDHTRPAACDSAMAAFRGLYCGVSLTDNADQLFGEHKPWSLTGGRGPDSAEGHCIVKVRSDARHDTYVTWGALQPATKTWTRACLDEAWVIITTEDSASKVDLARLRADIDALHGTGGGTAADPTPAPPAPSPTRTWLVNAVEHTAAVAALAFFGNLVGAGVGWYNVGVLQSAAAAGGAAVFGALEALAANVVNGGSASIPQALRARRGQ